MYDFTDPNYNWSILTRQERISAMVKWHLVRARAKVAGWPAGYPRSMKELAERFGVTVQTVYVDKRSPQFKKAYQAATLDAGHNIEIYDEAVQMLRELMHDEDARDTARVAAAKSLLSETGKFVSNRDDDDTSVMSKNIEEIDLAIQQLEASLSTDAGE